MLTDLRFDITKTQSDGTGCDENVEVLETFFILASADFPSVMRPEQTADWALHISGMVSLIETLDQKHYREFEPCTSR